MKPRLREISENAIVNNDFLHFLRFCIRWWKHFLIVLLLSVPIGFLICSPWIITPKYKSEVIIYPSAATTNNFLLISGMRFGGDKEIDEQIQILTSAILRDSITNKYNLINHYEIDTNNIKFKYLLNKEYADNIFVSRTRYNSILVEVYDKDADKAAAMAADIVQIGDKVKAAVIHKNLVNAYESMGRELHAKTAEIMALADTINNLQAYNYEKAVNLRKNHYQRKQSEVNTLRTSIDEVRKNEGVYDLDQQFNALYKQYLKASANYYQDSGKVAVMSAYYSENDTALINRKASLEGSRTLFQNLSANLVKLSGSGNKYNTLIDNYAFNKTILGNLEADYEYTISSFEKEYPNLNLETHKSRFKSELNLLNEIKTRHENARTTLMDLMPASYIISPAEASYKAVWPNKKLIIPLFSASVLMVTFLIIISIEKGKTVFYQLKSTNSENVAA